MLDSDGDSGGGGGPAGVQDGEGGEVLLLLLLPGDQGQQVPDRVRPGEEGPARDGVRESPPQILRVSLLPGEEGGVWIPVG